jgi:hypothetical protein
MAKILRTIAKIPEEQVENENVREHPTKIDSDDKVHCQRIRCHC